MHLVKLLLLLSMMCMLGNSEKKFRVLRDGDGIHFPRRPLTKTVAERQVRYMSSVVCKPTVRVSNQVYSRKVHFIYRLANPLFPPGVVENVDITFDTLPSGDLNATLLLTSDGECQVGILPFEAIPGEKFRAVYTTDEPFFTTGTPFTISLFSCKPEDYAFMFVCHDRSKEIVRNGRRVYCDGPHEILFGVYEYPPDRVKWCNAERDLWINYRLSFDNAFMKFIRTRAPCPVST